MTEWNDCVERVERLKKGLESVSNVNLALFLQMLQVFYNYKACFFIFMYE